jgi:hypothetical protein
VFAPEGVSELAMNGGTDDRLSFVGTEGGSTVATVPIAAAEEVVVSLTIDTSTSGGNTVFLAVVEDGEDDEGEDDGGQNESVVPTASARRRRLLLPTQRDASGGRCNMTRASSGGWSVLNTTFGGEGEGASWIRTTFAQSVSTNVTYGLCVLNCTVPMATSYAACGSDRPAHHLITHHMVRYVLAPPSAPPPPSSPPSSPPSLCESFATEDGANDFCDSLLNGSSTYTDCQVTSGDAVVSDRRLVEDTEFESDGGAAKLSPVPLPRNENSMRPVREMEAASGSGLGGPAVHETSGVLLEIEHGEVVSAPYTASFAEGVYTACAAG